MRDFVFRVHLRCTKLASLQRMMGASSDVIAVLNSSIYGFNEEFSLKAAALQNPGSIFE